MKSTQTAISDYSNLKSLIRLVDKFFSQSHKKKLLWVVFWAILLSLGEVGLAASVFPYIDCLTEQCPTVIEQTASFFGVPVIVLASSLLFLLLTTKLLIHALFSWKSASFHQCVQRDTVKSLLKQYLRMGWQPFSERHSNYYYRRCVSTAVDASHISQQCTVLISSCILITVLFLLMTWHNPTVSILLMVGFGVINFGSQRLIMRWQKQASERREQVLQKYSLELTEALLSFREIQVYRLEELFLSRIMKNKHAFTLTNQTLEFLPILPRLMLDFSFIAVLLIVVSSWFVLGFSVQALIPELIFYAVLARIMLPALMDILSIRAQLVNTGYNIQLVIDEITNAKQHASDGSKLVVRASSKDAYVFDNVSFAYNRESAILRDINLVIPGSRWVAITGKSGIGKSTLLELLCGILKPDTGSVTHLSPAESSGSCPVAYIPQQSVLIDGTIAENVAFGFDDIEPLKVMEALELSQLKPFIDSQPLGINSKVGADANKLSGGQRQRLALARALYREPELLLLDEATSGLDQTLESKCFTAMKKQRPNMTVVFITHRQPSLVFADAVYRLEDLHLTEVKSRD